MFVGECEHTQIACKIVVWNRVEGKEDKLCALFIAVRSKLLD